MTATDILELRATLGLTQKQLATLLGVDRATISNWERDHIVPSRLNQIKLKRVLEQHEEMTSKKSSETHCKIEQLSTLRQYLLHQLQNNLYIEPQCISEYNELHSVLFSEVS